MPATTLIPIAGPVGTVIALVIGAALTLVIAANFSILMKRTPNADGLFSFVKEGFGYDHSFLCMWAVALAYLSVLWANATAFSLMLRYLAGGVLQWGFHYTVAGYDVWAGEVIATLALLFAFGWASCTAKRLVRGANTLFALLLVVGVVALFALVCSRGGVSIEDFTPGFVTQGSAGERSRPLQILNIAVLAPWAFVGFEAVSFASSDYRFNAKKSFLIMALAILASTLIYALLTLLSLSALPEGVSGWQDYIAHLDSFEGIAHLPTFFAAKTALGSLGVSLLGVCVMCALCTTLLGLYRSLGRLLCAMAEDGVLPSWFSRKNSHQLPQNAIVSVMIVSAVIPFLGRTAIGWIVDITTISASIAYIYVSACTAKLSLSERGGRRTALLALGVVGIAISTLFFFFPLIPNLWSMSHLATESYLILAAWGIAGFVLFLLLFMNDKSNRFGASTVMWISMLFIILFSSLMWTRQVTHDETEKAIESISRFHAQTHIEQDIPMTGAQREAELSFMETQMEKVRGAQLSGSLVQLIIVIFALLIMFNIFLIQQKREKKLGKEKIRAEESNKAKTIFLSNMSHDIRTPMNAIIGYTNLARKPGASAEDIQGFLEKIDSSSKHLLALINDVLEMSRIESGKMDLEVTPCDLRRLMEDVRDMFATQMASKSIVYTVDCYSLKNPLVLCDKNRVNRVLLNLISNAYKFTKEGGAVSVSLFQKGEAAMGKCEYELRVKDSGIGMSSEFASHVFEAFERERTSTVSGIQGTGLGMAITKSIVDLMGGTISVHTEQGEGSEFVINVHFTVQEESSATECDKVHAGEAIPSAKASAEHGADMADGAESEETLRLATDEHHQRLLLVDDMEVNRELAKMILESHGFEVETAANGKEAVEKVAGVEAGYYNAVLMDIQMPVMNGHEASRAIRALGGEKAKVPIVAMTANAFAEDKRTALEAGMNAHIAKPIDEEQLFSVLAKIAGK